MRSNKIFTGLLISILFFSCNSKPIQPVFELVLCDNSTSSVCNAKFIAEYIKSFISSNHPNGSLMQVYVTGCGIDDLKKIYEVKIPKKWGNGITKKKDEWLYNEKERILYELSIPEPKDKCSAVAPSIWQAGKTLKEHPAFQLKLSIISDLREVSFLGNFERNLPEPEQFIKTLQKENLITDMQDIVVEVCGVHDKATFDVKKWTALHSEKLRKIWFAVFAAMGVKHITLKRDCFLY